MKKKGQAETLELITLFEILAGLTVATFLILAALSWNSISNFNKIYTEEDLKLISNSLYSTTGDIKLTYSMDSNLKIKKWDQDKIDIIHTPEFLSSMKKSDLILEADAATHSLNIRRDT